jgi:TRAP transporter TAXI family solute receptor
VVLRAKASGDASSSAKEKVPMRSHLLSGLGLLISMLPAAVAARAGERVMVSLGTATPGGGFPVYGEAVAAQINAEEPTLEVRTENTKGSTENIPLLEAGKLDIALVQGEAAFEALNGIGRAPAHLPILAAMYATPGMFVVRADSPYRTIEDLKGKPVVFGAKGSGLVILARYVLDGLGLDRDRDFEAIFLDRAGDGPQMIASGKAAALWGGGSGWPGFIAVAQSPPGARFIVPDAAGIDRIRGKHAFLMRLTVAPGAFPGQSESLLSVGSWSFILTRPTLPDDVAYRLARALHRGEVALGNRLAQARETTAANTAASARRELLHPGVSRYLQEIGLLR